MGVVWLSRYATVTVGTKLSSVGSASTLATQVSGTDYSARVKNLKISAGESDVDLIPTMGVTSGLANAEVEQKSTGTMREATFTLIHQDGDFSGFATNTVSTGGAASTYTRIRGDGTRTQKAVLINLSDGTNITNVLMNNAYFTKLGDITLNANGSGEQEVTIKCLASDYYEESNF